MHTNKILCLLLLGLFMMSVACSPSSYNSCNELKLAAEDEQLIEKIWGKLISFFEKPLSYEYSMGPASIIFYEKDANKFNVDWKKLGIKSKFDRKIEYNLKDGFKYLALNEEDVILPKMIGSIYVGEHPNRLKYELIQPSEKEDEITYKLSIECNNRLLESRGH